MTLWEYEARLQPVREDFATRDAVRLFLGGIASTESVPGFLLSFLNGQQSLVRRERALCERASERSAALGFYSAARFLADEASLNRGGELPCRDNLHALLSIIDVRPIRSAVTSHRTGHAPAFGTTRYLAICESVVEGPLPFGLIAVLYEMSQIVAAHGAALLECCRLGIGVSREPRLAFLRRYIAQEIERVDRAGMAMGSVIRRYPSVTGGLVNAGVRAVGAYGRYLDDCGDIGCGRLMLGEQQMAPNPS